MLEESLAGSPLVEIVWQRLQSTTRLFRDTRSSLWYELHNGQVLPMLSGWYISLAKASHQITSCDLSSTNTQLPKIATSKASHQNTVTRSGQLATLESFLLAEASHQNVASMLSPAHTAR